MWCPNCKIEYVTGIRRCADCGTPLSDTPPADTPTTKNNTYDAKNIYEEEAFSSIRQASAPVFVESETKLADVRSTAYTFTVIGAIGLLLDILVFFGAIPLELTNGYMRYMMCGILGVLFLFFLGIGIRSFLEQKETLLQMEAERERTAFLSNTFFSLATSQTIDADADISAFDLPEQLYYKRYRVMKKYLSDIDPEISDGYRDYLIDTFYNRLFPDS